MTSVSGGMTTSDPKDMTSQQKALAAEAMTPAQRAEIGARIVTTYKAACPKIIGGGWHLNKHVFVHVVPAEAEEVKALVKEKKLAEQFTVPIYVVALEPQK